EQRASQTKRILDVEEKLEEKIDKLEEAAYDIEGKLEQKKTPEPFEQLSEEMIITLEKQIARIELLLEQHKDKDSARFKRLRKKVKRLKQVVGHHRMILTQKKALPAPRAARASTRKKPATKKKPAQKSLPQKARRGAKSVRNTQLLVGSKTGKTIHTASCIALQRVPAEKRIYL
ncbi:hypothetical protein COY95_02845, partial [Candidatus Woesearchaeota archaeon CG_4_10_14_0_8_um_filter_47_5]